MHDDTPKLAHQLLDTSNDDLTYESLDQASDDLVEKLRPLYEKQVAIRERIIAGLAKNGKHLKRNAMCPCGSGKKFKKCCLPKMKKLQPKSETPTDANSN